MAHDCHNSACPPAGNAPERCPLCGGANDCQLCTAAAYKGPCWCASVRIPDELIARVPAEARNKACICRKCVMEFHHAKESGVAGPKIRPGDFYFDNGLMVFTAAYHSRRGYCCGNDCRHCPFQPQPANSGRPVLPILALLFMLGIATSTAVTSTENFSANPTNTGWQIHGDTNLFMWDSTNQNLRVTWDSSKTNSYFHRPLGTILTPDDDFTLSFDLTFEDYASGVNPAKPGTFEAAIGFLNLDQATKTNFFRGAGTSSLGPLNIVEFDFFPAFDTFLPTIAQTIVGTNHSSPNWLYNHDKLLEMTPGETFRVTMNYSSVTRTLTTTITNNGTEYGAPQTQAVPATFNFRVSTLSISSYSDAIQPPIPGSILAHGMVDNFTVVTPPPLVENLAGGFSGTNWQVQFASRTNWLYTLERTANLATWTNASLVTSGNGTTLTLSDSNPPTGQAFYRVKANRP